MQKDKKIVLLLKMSKIFSVVTVIALVLLLVIAREQLTVENVLKLMPENYVYAALFLILLYAFKSLTVLFPVMLLYVVCGIALPTPLAILVNFIGLFLENTLEYAVGYKAGTGLIGHLEEKYPKIRRLGDISARNELFVSYILRIASFLPVGIVGLLLGSERLDFKKYTVGSLIGMAPSMIAATLVGVNIFNPLSPEFILSCAITVIITVCSFLYLKLRKRILERREARTKPKWVRIVFRRRVFVILLLVLQVALIVMMFLSVGTKYSLVAPIMSIVSYVVAVYILGIEDKPAYKLTWVVLILAVPFFGGVFYLMLKNQGGAKRFEKKLEAIEEKTVPLLERSEETEEELYKFDRNCCQNSKYLFSHKGFPVYKNTSMEYFETGEKKFERLVSELRKAEKFIFLEYFIISQGVMWETILEILKEKAENGVEVRVIFDDIGCFMLLPKNYHKTLEKMGIKCVLFNPFTPVLSTVQNNRDHRKIAVIDGCVAFTGGINIGDEYINIKERFGHWKDTAIMIKGEAVWSFTVMFLQTWNVFRAEDEDFTVFKANSKEITDGFVQPYGDRPLDSDAVAEHVYMSIINRACDYLYITTPYLILEDSMSAALCDAAKSGVDVKIITPHIPDKAYVHMTTRSYYPELLKAGVRIFEYTNGFIHSKTFVSDDKTATVGTVNADYRSLYLHFECGVLIHGAKAVEDIKKDFNDTIKQCAEIELRDCSRNVFIRIIQRVLRLFAPLM